MKEPPLQDDLAMFPSPDEPEGPTEFGESLEDTTGEPTQITRVRAFPREWEVVDPRRNEQVFVQIEQWEAFFRLEAIGDDGCFVRAVLPEDKRPLPLGNDCRLVLNLGDDGMPINIQGKVQGTGISSNGEATMKILFKDLSVEDAVALFNYRECLKEIPEELGPQADADAEPGIPPDEALTETLEALPPEPRKITRKQIMRALGAAAAGVFLVVAGGAAYLAIRSPEGSDITTAESPELLPLIPLVRKPTQEEITCAVLFDERGYRPKCPDTTKPRLTWRPGQQKGAPVLRAGISYRRGGKLCETAPDAVTVIRGQTMPAVNHAFQCK